MKNRYKNIFKLFGKTQSDQSESTGITQPVISQKTRGVMRMSKTERLAVIGLSEALSFLTRDEKVRWVARVKIEMGA